MTRARASHGTVTNCVVCCVCPQLMDVAESTQSLQVTSAAMDLVMTARAAVSSFVYVVNNNANLYAITRNNHSGGNSETSRSKRSTCGTTASATRRPNCAIAQKMHVPNLID